MTTYTLQGTSLTFDAVTHSPTSVTPATVTVVVPDGVSVFTYQTIFSHPNETDEITITSEFSTLTLDGVTYSASISSPVLNTFFGYINWGAGNTSYVLNFLGEGSDTSSSFTIGGDALPSLLTLAQMTAYGATITGMGGVTSGLYAPNTNIAFATIPGVTSTENDVIIGSGDADTFNGGVGNDRLDGGDGNDHLDGGDGLDILNGGDGDDTLTGGTSSSDLRDVIYGGAGNDTIDGGYGNDELRGDAGDDTIAGGFGADLVIGGAGNDVMTGSAFGDEVHGGDGFDFINGGFGHDRVNGGADGDKFYHLGIADHGSDWIQDYTAAEGDVLMWGGGAATAADFLIQRAETANAGTAGVEEIFVTHIPSGNLLWALVDGDAQGQINIQINGTVFDLLA